METPTLKAELRKDGAGLKVWCEYCDIYHLHGHGEGHRTADCDNRNSPYLKTGYYIKLQPN